MPMCVFPLFVSNLLLLAGDMQSPVVSLAGLEDPSVAVRFSPLLYTPKHNASRVGEESESLFQGPYRCAVRVQTDWQC